MNTLLVFLTTFSLGLALRYACLVRGADRLRRQHRQEDQGYIDLLKSELSAAEDQVCHYRKQWQAQSRDNVRLRQALVEMRRLADQVFEEAANN